MQADAECPLGEPLVGGIVPEFEPVFGAGGEHPVRFVNPLRDKVVYHNTDVGFVATERERLVGCRPCAGLRLCAAGTGVQRRVNAGDEPLSACFFIAGRSIDLPRGKKPRYPAGL